MRNRLLKMADLFCGAGGTSTGAVHAFEEQGWTVDLTGINHDPDSIHTHMTNHPKARHLLTGIESVNPRDLYGRGELDILWASPECTHHSNARGGRPIQEQSRSTAMCVARWAEALLPPVILIENVKEFLTWGPLDSKDRPIKGKRGAIYGAWKGMLEAVGYRVEHRIICCADMGDPTTRTRLFIQCVRGRPRWRKSAGIRWPDPTHQKMPETDIGEAELFLAQRKPWRAAREIIDWSLKGQLLTERKKPLAEKTMRRIIVGFFKQLEKKGFGPFIVPNFGERETQTSRSHDVDQPAPTVTSHGAGALVEPQAFIVGAGGPEYAAKPRDVELPMGTVTCGDRKCVVEPVPMVLPQNGSNAARDCTEPAPTLTTTSRGVGLAAPILVRFQGNHAGRDDGATRSQSPADPLGTLTTENRYGLAEPEPMVVQLRGGQACHIDGSAKSTLDPLGTVTTKGTHHALVQPIVVEMKGTKPGQVDITGHPDSRPLGAVTTQNTWGLAQPEAVVVEIDHQGRGAPLRGVGEPLSTATTKNRHGLAEPAFEFLVQVNHGNGKCGTNGDGRRVKDLGEPLPTVCGERGEFALLEPSLLPQQSGGEMRPVSEPAPTVATSGAISIIEAYLVKFYGTGVDASISDPLDTVTTKDRHAIVLPVIVVNGQTWLVNFRFRMLQPHELAGAQGFPAGYEFKGTKTKQVQQIGNAVPVHTAKAIVRAVLRG